MVAACTPGFAAGESAAIDALRVAQLETIAALVSTAPRAVFHTFSNQGCAGLEACLDACRAKVGPEGLRAKTKAFVFDSAADMHADGALFHQVITKSVAAELKAMAMPLHQVLDKSFERNVALYCEAWPHASPEPREGAAGSLDRLLRLIRDADAHSLCLYSSDDKLITPDKVEEFARALKAHHPDHGRSAAAKFRGPAHVRLFADDPARYAAELAKLLVATLGLATSDSDSTIP